MGMMKRHAEKVAMEKSVALEAIAEEARDSGERLLDIEDAIVAVEDLDFDRARDILTETIRVGINAGWPPARLRLIQKAAMVMTILDTMTIRDVDTISGFPFRGSGLTDEAADTLRWMLDHNAAAKAAKAAKEGGAL